MAEKLQLKLENKDVAFANLSKKGSKAKGKQVNQNSIGVVLNKKEYKKLKGDIEDIWETIKGKVKEPSHDILRFISKDNEDKNLYILWANNNVDTIKLMRKDGTNFGRKEFDSIGRGSSVTVSVSIYGYNNDNGAGVGIKLNQVMLNEYVKYEGEESLDGGYEIEDDDGVSGEEKEPEKKKKKKK